MQCVVGLILYYTFVTILYFVCKIWVCVLYSIIFDILVTLLEFWLFFFSNVTNSNNNHISNYNGLCDVSGNFMANREQNSIYFLLCVCFLCLSIDFFFFSDKNDNCLIYLYFYFNIYVEYTYKYTFIILFISLFDRNCMKIV